MDIVCVFPGTVLVVSGRRVTFRSDGFHILGNVSRGLAHAASAHQRTVHRSKLRGIFMGSVGRFRIRPLIRVR